MKETLNLLPPEITTIKTRRGNPLYYLIYIVSLYIAVIMILWIFNIIESRGIQAEINTLKQKKAEIQARYAVMPKPSSGVAIPIEKEILHELERVPQWSKIISEISLIIPEHIWLSSVEANQDTESIAFKGYAFTQMEIASFIAMIEDSDLFDDVKIVYSQKGEKEVSFELKARLRWI